MQKKLIAYSGPKYTIEWYYNERGKSEAREYFLELDFDQQKKLAHLLTLMGDRGEIMNERKFINEGNDIYAFKPDAHRFLCFFFIGKKIIITNAYPKKSEKMPKNVNDRAMRLMADYIERVKKGKYYDKKDKINS